MESRQASQVTLFWESKLCVRFEGFTGAQALTLKNMMGHVMPFLTLCEPFGLTWCYTVGVVSRFSTALCFAGFRHLFVPLFFCFFFVDLRAVHSPVPYEHLSKPVLM